MNRRGVRHLGVTDAAGFVTGAVSARDLLRLRAEGAIALGDAIEEAAGVPELARAWSQHVPRRGGSARGRRIRPRGGGGGVAPALRAHRARRGAGRKPDAGARRGPPPCAYAFAVLGSAGRGESLLAMDQDNALVFAKGAPGRTAGCVVREARQPRRRHPARGRRALLQGRRHGEKSAMARIGRDLARAHRALDRPVKAGRSPGGRYFLRHARRAWRHHPDRDDLARGFRRGQRTVRLRETAGRRVGFDHARASVCSGASAPSRAASTSRDRVCSKSSVRHGRWRSAITWSNGPRPRGLPGSGASISAEKTIWKGFWTRRGRSWTSSRRSRFRIFATASRHPMPLRCGDCRAAIASGWCRRSRPSPTSTN